MRISDWSSDVCSSDLRCRFRAGLAHLICRSLSSILVNIGDDHLCAFAGQPLRRRKPDAVFRPGHNCDAVCQSLHLVSPQTLNADPAALRSAEHTSELQSLMRISYAVFCLKKKKKLTRNTQC